MTEKKLEERLKIVKGIAKNDGKRYIQVEAKHEKPLSVQDYFASCVSTIYKPERLKKSFGYTDEQISIMLEVYNEAFWKSYEWWQRKMDKVDVILAKYKSIFDEAEQYALGIDVSDIKDGFPCGWGNLYLKAEARKTELGKALRALYVGDSRSAKVCYWSAYKIPIKLPQYGQCVAFDERVCGKVAEFLTSKGVPAGVYTWID